MKRIQLIEWGIITIALIFGYKFFESIFSALVQIFYSFQGVNEDILEILIPSILMIVAYAVCFILLIKKSGQLASYLQGIDNNEVISVKIGKKSLLQVILIAICITTVLSNIPGMLLYLFDSFREKVGPNNRDIVTTGPFRWHQFKLGAIQIIVATVVIFFSKDITNWFLRKKEIDELSFDSDTQNK